MLPAEVVKGNKHCHCIAEIFDLLAVVRNQAQRSEIRLFQNPALRSPFGVLSGVNPQLVRKRKNSHNSDSRFLRPCSLRFLEWVLFRAKWLGLSVETVSFPVSFPFVSGFPGIGVVVETRLRADW